MFDSMSCMQQTYSPWLKITQTYPNVDICVADNCFNWDDLRSWLEDQYPDIGLRWVKDARLTMACIPRHSLDEQIKVNQATITANLA
ncbi:hypothetical protein WJX82_008938 [Trebouxia sp. C0006]